MAFPLAPSTKMNSVANVVAPAIQNINSRYNLRFHFVDDDNKPYGNTPYIVYFPDGKEIKDTTDKEGYTKSYFFQNPEQVKAHLFFPKNEKQTGNYNLRFHFVDDNDQPYRNQGYVVFLPEGKEVKGITDENGYTESYYFENPEKVKARLTITKS